MNVSKIGIVNSSNLYSFKDSGSDNQYENPVSRSTERNLAILTSVCGSAVAGVIAGGLTSMFVKTEPISEKSIDGLVKAKNIPVILGLATAAVALIVTLPAKIYNTKVSAFAKQKEMDVFSRDRNLKSNLTEEVDKEVQNPEVSLDKKLDDNLKLQMANRGNAIGIANVTAQAQG